MCALQAKVICRFSPNFMDMFFPGQSGADKMLGHTWKQLLPIEDFSPFLDFYQIMGKFLEIVHHLQCKTCFPNVSGALKLYLQTGVPTGQ